MSVAESLALKPTQQARGLRTAGLLQGSAMIYLSIIVLLPLAAVFSHALSGGLGTIWRAVTDSETVSALVLTVLISAVVVAINAVSGTLIAWVLVRDSFRGKSLVNSIIDLPFALPTIVAGLVLLELYGPRSPMHLDAAYTRAGVLLALLFVTLPFGVRSVQPVLMEIDREMEAAAASLGAGPAVIFRRIVLPNLVPAILSGAGLGFARSMGEFGSVVLISGNIPFQTEVASVRIFGQISSGDMTDAAVLSMLLLLISIIVLLGINALQRLGSARHG
jgi:sulfate transport system permease protein